MNRDILRIALPSIVSNVTVPLLSLVDTAIVGHLGAASYIGAIAVGGMLFNMIYWVFGFLRMGTGGLTAQAHGAGNVAETARTLCRSLGVAAGVSAALILLQIPLLEIAFRFIDATPEVEVQARLYFRILIWGAPAVLGLYGFTGWFLGRQNARFPMYIAIAQNLVNIGVSLLLVVGCGLKVGGVAAGTLTAQYAGLLMAAGLWWRNYRAEFCRGRLTGVWERGALRRFFAVNRDIFLRTLCLVAVTVSFTSAGAAMGDVTLAVNALLMQFFLLFSYVMDGFAYAGEALGGRFCGAADRRSFLLLTRRLFVVGTVLAVIFTGLYAFGGDLLLSLLTDRPEVRSAAREFLPYAAAVPLVGFAAFLFDGLFIGCTATRPMLLAMTVATVVFFTFVLLPTPLAPNHALWLAFLAYLLLRGAVQAACVPRVLRRFAPTVCRKNE